jgi:hypothetical protein
MPYSLSHIGGSGSTVALEAASAPERTTNDAVATSEDANRDQQILRCQATDTDDGSYKHITVRPFNSNFRPGCVDLKGRLTSWETLPNFKLGTFSHVKSTGDRVYVGLDGKCTCKHGELASTIRSWVTKEKPECAKKRRKMDSGEEQQSVEIVAEKTCEVVSFMNRSSTCNCTDAKSMSAKDVSGPLPSPPTSYYAVVSSQPNSVSFEQGETAACKDCAFSTPLACESGNVFLGKSGQFYCGHGHAFTVNRDFCIGRKRKAGVATSTGRKTLRFRGHRCGCLLVLPNRLSFPEVPLADPVESVQDPEASDDSATCSCDPEEEEEYDYVDDNDLPMES